MIPIVLALVFCLGAHQASAMLASPMPFTVSQPNGNNVTLFVRGNEHRNFLQDTQGYTVLQSTAGNVPVFVYAAQDLATGGLMPSRYMVGAVNPMSVPTLKPNLSPPASPFSAAAAGSPALMPGGGPNGTSATAPGGTTTSVAQGGGGLLSLGRRRRAAGDPEQIARVRRLANTGTVNNLVLMVRWSDCPYQEKTATTPGLPTVADLQTLFNGANNSVRDVYRVNSYGKLDIVSKFTGWITVSASEKTVAAGESGLACCALHNALAEALTKADATIDFSQFDIDKDGVIDVFTIIHSGYAAEFGGTGYENRVWSHKWSLPSPFTSKEGVTVENYHISPAMWGTSGTTIGRIGVIAHESGHFLGLPDLYDVDGYEGQNMGQGLGSYSLMANSWGFDGSQNFPPLLDAWCRIAMRWITPTLITAAGTYSVKAAALPGSQVYKITKNFPDGEYLLIENRQPISYDGGMRQGGLAIYHVDDTMESYWTQGWPGQANWPQNGNHYRIALLQADGLFSLESSSNRGDAGDVWYPAGKSVLSPATTPNTKAYQGGVVKDTGITITVTSPPGETMTFTVAFATPGTPTATCTDKIQNQGETGVDCGGPCAACPTCTDKIQNQGETGIDCGGPCAACPTCTNKIKNQGETGVDCGGPCAPCVVAPTCSDKIKNQGETGIDCGGPCPACRATCSDKIKNQGETGIDCGGPCAKCPSCSDKIQNQGELGVDCGGPCKTKCPTTCSDGVQNGKETGMDCGGPCANCTSLRVGAMALSQTRPSANANYKTQVSVRVMGGADHTTPVPGATVTVRFTRTVGANTTTEYRNGTTSAAGIVMIASTTLTKVLDSSVVACVSSTAKKGYMYAMTVNLATCINAAGKTSASMVYKF